jgi:hypothetical protein
VNDILILFGSNIIMIIKIKLNRSGSLCVCDVMKMDQ